MSTYEFKLPDVGEGLGQGELLKWHVATGEPVKADQILCDVQTDKAIVEIPAPVNGVLKEQGGQPGEMIDVGGRVSRAATSTPGNKWRLTEKRATSSSLSRNLSGTLSKLRFFLT